MRWALMSGIAVVLAANGLAMLVWPQIWYQIVPTVPYTGPFNGHFVRDIGCAYLTSAGALGWYAFEPSRARSAALTGLAFLLAHAVVHVWDALVGRCTPHHFAEDFVGVFLLPLLALALVTMPMPARRAQPFSSQGEPSC